jgi:hypothetical protein
MPARSVPELFRYGPQKKDDRDKRGGVKDAGGATWRIAAKVEWHRSWSGSSGQGCNDRLTLIAGSVP